MSDEAENETASEAIVSDEAEAVTASAGTAASVTSTPGVGSASEQPDASASEQFDTEQPDASASEQSSAAQPDASASEPRNARKVREGVVVSNKMDKTAVVAVVERVRHPKYNKFVLQTKRLYAHDETNDVNVGDRVRVTETRPLSKQKRWRVSQVLERAK